MGKCTADLQKQVNELLDRVEQLEQLVADNPLQKIGSKLPSPPTTVVNDDPLDDLGSANLKG